MTEPAIVAWVSQALSPLPDPPSTIWVWCDAEMAPTTADVRDEMIGRVARCRACQATSHARGDGTEFPFAYLDADDTPERTYVTCRVCGYEKVLGEPCGEPCL